MENKYESLTREQLVEALDAANGRFEETLQSARHILYRLNAKKGGYDYLSPYFAELTGHPLAEFKQVLLQQLPNYFHSDDRERIFGEHGELARAVNSREGNKTYLLVEYRLRKADGTYCWLRDQNTIYCSADGQIESIVGSAYDISEQKKAIQELQEQQEQLSVLINSSQAGIILVDPAGKITMANCRMAEMFGYSMEELIGSDYPSLLHSNEKSNGKNRMHSLISGDIDHVALERHYIRKDGSDFWGYLSGRRHENVDGKLVSLVGHITDITELKLANKALYEREQQLSLALRAANQGLYDLNLQTGEAKTNAEYALMLGYQPDEFIETNQKWLDRLHPDDLERVTKNFRDYLSGKIPEYKVEFRQQTATGGWVWILSLGSTVSWDCEGKPLRMLGTHTDITDRKRAEEERLHLEKQLLHAQKLESLGVLAGGIAHDFNNILTTIIGNAELALMRLNPESPVLDNLHRIEQAAARAGDLARQMLAYSGKGKFVIEAIDLNRMVEEMGHMLEVSISKKAILRLNLTKPLPSIDADVTQIRQIIMNLVINASEAIGDRSGVIAITTGCVECDEAYLRDIWLTDPLPQELYVFMEIADTGCGMDKETLGKLFDPFFTTKFTGRGLGMAAVLGIVRGHKGAIKVYSEPDKGSTFKVLFPAGERPAEIFDGAAQIDSWRGSGLVLLVDDEETIRGISSEILKELGFTVVTATDGRDAVAIFKSTPGISFVILDLTMPHMDGEQCFRELRQLDPNVRVIMSSGFSEHEVTQKFSGKGLAGFIQKPYKLSTLQDVIRKM